MPKPKKINVAVLCGGVSNEREVSLRTGEQIVKALPEAKYNAQLVEITKGGQWLLADNPRKKHLTAKGKSGAALVMQHGATNLTLDDNETADIVFVGLHGKFGEDGKVQAILELMGLPYTGSNVLASALGMNKIKTIEIVEKQGVCVPKFITTSAVPRGKARKEFLQKVKRAIGYPCVVKPNESGSSVGVFIAQGENELVPALKTALKEDRAALVQKYVSGRELTCGVMGNSGQTDLTALPPIEIIPRDTFFDYHAKYHSEATREVCPAPISKKLTKEIQKLAVQVHEILGCDGLTRSDFIFSTKDKELYFLEINTIPGLTEASLCPKEAKAAGMSFRELLDAMVELALLKAGK